MPSCQLCLERAVAWRPEALKDKKPLKPVKSCKVRKGAQSLKCRHCEKYGKSCDSLPRKFRPVLKAFFPLQVKDWSSDAAYLADAAVGKALVDGNRALRELRRGTPADRARSAAAAAAAASAREADDLAAHSRALQAENLRVQIDISNSLRAIAQHLASSRLPDRVGPETLNKQFDDSEGDESEPGTDDDDATPPADATPRGSNPAASKRPAPATIPPGPRGKRSKKN